MADKEYIEREATLNNLAKSYFAGVLDDLIHAEDAVNAVPAADVVEVRHGRWIDKNGNTVEWDSINKNCPKSSCYCSECKEWLTASDEYPAIGLYCPNCGAKMNGGVDDGKADK